MTEICVEVFCSLNELKKLIEQKNYKFVESYDNHDVYFTHFKRNIKNIDYKKLLENSIILRNIKGEDCDIKNIVYKKKTFDKNGNVINEIKSKLKIDDVEMASKIFKTMGLTCWCDYINKNFEYRLGEIIITLQYVKELGVFIEIEEYPSIKSKSDEEKFEILSDIVKSFGLKIGTDYSVKKPYLFLMIRKNG